MTNNNKNVVTCIKSDWECDRKWKLKIMDILKRNKLVTPKELELLENFVK